MNPVLMDIVIYQLAFLALAPEQQLDEDAAVGQLESISAELKKLTPEDLAIFISRVQAVAQRQQDAEARRCIEAIPEHCGLIDDVKGPQVAEPSES